MKLLVLGHKGMLGNAVCAFFAKQDGYEILTTTDRWGNDSFEASIRNLNPDVIINCIGMIPQKKPTAEMYKHMNVDLPLFLDGLGKKVIHPSTDCEFSGNVPANHKYTKTDVRDAQDDYGKSKAESSKWLEENGKNTKIIRVSIIGHELNSHVALLDWFLNAGPEVNGYTNHYWNGITTLEWAKRAKFVLEHWDNLPALNQYGTEEIYSKCRMLELFKEVYGKKTVIRPFDAVHAVSKCLTTDAPFPSLKDQLKELKAFYGK